MSGIMIILGIGLQERGKKHLWIAISTVGYMCVYPPPPSQPSCTRGAYMAINGLENRPHEVCPWTPR